MQQMNKGIRPSVFKRFLALLIDFLILGVIGFVLSLFLEDFFVSLGVYGTLMGSVITITYLGVTQSKTGGGQSIGKRAIDAKVVGINGDYLSTRQSFLRAFILVFPFMNMEIFTSGRAGIVILPLLILTILGTFYLLLVNKSRRTLHDLIIKSMVVNSNLTELQLDELNDRKASKLMPAAVIAVGMLVFGFYKGFSEGSFSNLLSLKTALEKQEGVITVNEVKSSTTTLYNSDPPKTSSLVALTVRIDDEKEASNLNSRYFTEFYSIVSQELPDLLDFDGVTITLYYGYNIGIARKTKSVTKTIVNENANRR